jgi:hypothetical protein
VEWRTEDEEVVAIRDGIAKRSDVIVEGAQQTFRSHTPPSCGGVTAEVKLFMQ